MGEGDIENYFLIGKFKGFRENQREYLNKIKNSLEKGVEVVIIEGPTGFGKSPINMALGRYFAPSFYISPQVKLINQLDRDFGPKEKAIDGGYGDVMSLLGRKNYKCRESGKKSHKCPIYLDKDEYCSGYAACTYWRQKRAVINSRVAILTFAMFTINDYLLKSWRKYLDMHPNNIERCWAFERRNLLIVDECHDLENQIASLFCGFNISPLSFGFKENEKNMEIWNGIKILIPKSKDIIKYIPFIEKIRETCENLIFDCKRKDQEEKLEKMIIKIDYLLEELDEGLNWVVDKKDLSIKIWTKNKAKKNEDFSYHFKPIRIDRFLLKKLWSQTRQIVLSSATIPYRNNIQKWLERIGLKGKSFEIFRVPMTFPKENREIIMSTIGGKMTYKKEQKNWERNVSIVKDIISNHINERGVIHVVRYERGSRLYEELKKEFSVFLHDKEKVSGDIIEEWIASKKKVLISPAITDGVDLRDDLCRYQILYKVPYPSKKDSRVCYIVDKEGDWEWYYEETIKTIVQMYGRAVRSKTDHAKFYIVDGSFSLLYKYNKHLFPSWFSEAIKKYITSL